MSTVQDTQANLPPVPREGGVKRKHAADRTVEVGKENLGRISGVKKAKVERHPETPVKVSWTTNYL